MLLRRKERTGEEEEEREEREEKEKEKEEWQCSLLQNENPTTGGLGIII